MTTAGLTVTPSEVETPPPINGKNLITVLTGKPAPRRDGKNLFIQIDVGTDEATFHCQDPEHVGAHKGRQVLFCADKHCWLKFTNPSVFLEPYLELMKDKVKPAHVADVTQNAETDYVVCVDEPKTAKAATMANAPPYTLRPPVIVVP